MSISVRLATTGILLSACAATYGDDREWTSQAGTKFEAKLVRLHLDNAILKKNDGKEMVVPIAKLSALDQQFLKKQAAALSTNGECELREEMKECLVKISGDKLEHACLSNEGDLKFIAVYYAAQWCRPCGDFTSELVEFYDKNKKENSNFEVVFVSSDRSEREWKEHIANTQMPWLSVRYDHTGKTVLRNYAGAEMPCLVLLTPEGEVLSDSYVNNTYVGPKKVLTDLKKMISKTTETNAQADEVSAAPVFRALRSGKVDRR